MGHVLGLYATEKCFKLLEIREGSVILRNRHTDDEMVRGGIGPGAFRDEGRANGGKFSVGENADGAALDVDGVAGVDEGFGGGGRECGAVL